MSHVPRITSAVAQRQYFPGTLMRVGEGPAWEDILVEIHSRPLVETGLLVPAVAEPQIIWQMSGTVICEERELDGGWSSHRVSTGDLFLVSSSAPYELRWRSLDGRPLVCMHVSLALPLLAAAAREVLGETASHPVLRELHLNHDSVLAALLEQLRVELMERPDASALFVRGIAQSLAVHLVRTYRDDSAARLPRPATALPSSRLRLVETLMARNLEKGVQIAELAGAADMSESHFSRMFKVATGFPPLRYFIRLRMAKARQLLRETNLDILEIGHEVGYTSASHFIQVFRKEAGQTPVEYRNTQPAVAPRVFL